MSVKGSSKGVKLSKVFPVFIIAAVIATALRIWQAFNIIEPETGFFSKQDFTVIALYLILIAAAVTIFMIAYLCKSVPVSSLPREKSVFLGIVNIIFTATLLVDAVSCFNKYFELRGGYDPFGMGMSGTSMSSYLLKTGAIPMLIEMIFAIISMVYFIVLAAVYFGKNIDTEKLKLLALSPVFWATFRLVQRFTRTISFINVSDLLLELFMIAFSMLFFMFFAQVSSGVNSRPVMNKVYAYGLISALIGTVVSLPKLIVLIFSPSLSVVSFPLEICNLGLVLFIITMLAKMAKMPYNTNITLKQYEKMKKEEQEQEE